MWEWALIMEGGIAEIVGKGEGDFGGFTCKNTYCNFGESFIFMGALKNEIWTQ